MRTARHAILLFAVASVLAVPGAVQAATPLPTAGARVAAPTPVVSARTITITDAKVGKLTFDALAAGSPSAARRGKLVLLLHGWPQNAETWRPMLGRLAAAGYYAVAPSQRGFSPGARPLGTAAYDTVNMVNDTLAIADALGAPRFHLVSHDWGGMVAWRVAAAAPARVRSMTVLSTTHPKAILESSLDLSTGQLGSLFYQLFMIADGVDQTILSFDGYLFIESLKGQGLPEAQARQYYTFLKDPAAMRASLEWYRANSPFTSSPEWMVQMPVTTVPTTLIWGRNEFAFTRDSAERTPKFVKAPYRFVELPGIGHWIPETATSVTTDAMLQQIRATS